MLILFLAHITPLLILLLLVYSYRFYQSCLISFPVQTLPFLFLLLLLALWNYPGIAKLFTNDVFQLDPLFHPIRLRNPQSLPMSLPHEILIHLVIHWIKEGSMLFHLFFCTHFTSFITISSSLHHYPPHYDVVNPYPFISNTIPLPNN